MIPKVIHYCWFGGNPLPDSAIKCIESWKKYCPDYKIIQWNEKNYNVLKNKYMADAYKEKKWAFVSDYARVDIVYTYGGIYFDTDVELIASIDFLLNDKLFCGWENRDPLLDKIGQNYENSVAFGLGFGAEKEHIVLKRILEMYEKISFYNCDGTLNLIACPKYQTNALTEFGLDTKERIFQKLDFATIYPEDYFSPKSILTGKIHLTNNTVAIHHFSMSWVSIEERQILNIKWKLCEVLPFQIVKVLILFIALQFKIKKRIKHLFV